VSATGHGSAAGADDLRAHTRGRELERILQLPAAMSPHESTVRRRELPDTAQIADLDERVAAETAAPEASPDLVPLVGSNLRRLRIKRGLSLERLSRQSGVSRAMLSQVELGYSAPTINVMWRIARALDVPFGALLTEDPREGVQVLRSADAKRLNSHDGTFSSRALFPFDAPRRSELYEIRLRGRAIERAGAHQPGTTENLVVSIGRVTITVGGERFALERGDAVLFAADREHVYENPEPDDALLYVVMSYASAVGG
jgi:transcriptional regulator with XRE-family HTH domain